jgi:protein ImuB
MSVRADRRIAAIVLPDLLVEVARPPSPDGRPDDPYTPTAVILIDCSRSAAKDKQPLAAVNRAAHACGVRPGHTVVEASAYAAKLRILSVDEAHVRRALETVAEVAFAFGATVHMEPWDSVWVDVSGAAHLFGGEEALVAEMAERVADLGLTARVAIADGPRIADALARFSTAAAGASGQGERISPRGGGRASMAKLPLRALRPMPSKAGAPLGALDDAIHVLFARLGVFSVEDLLALPHAELTARLRYQDMSQGTRADILSLGMGTDPMPLTPYQPAHVLTEDISFDDPIELTEPLLFVLRRLTSRLAARLQGRGQATNDVELTLHYDAKIFAREIDPNRQPREVFSIALPAPLATEIDLFRTLKSKVENLEIATPIVSLEISLSRIVDAPHVQLDLSRDEAVRPDALPALLAELSADIGDENVGVLTIVDTHRPEARSKLISPADPKPKRGRIEASDPPRTSKEPTRLLPEPIPLGSIAIGSTVFVGHATFEIVRVAFDRRLDGIEWWARSEVSRDYVNLWLASPSLAGSGRSITEGWAYVDRSTGETFLHGLWE